MSKLGSQSNRKDKIVVDLFILHHQNIDLISLSEISRITGGNLNYYYYEDKKELK